jgi:threonine/homoserine/homoserine lactone efflux protein
VLFAIGRALALGRRAALISVVGNATGMYVQVILVSLGLGILLEQSIVLMTIVKFAGAAFLVYLGIQAIRHRHDASAPVEKVRQVGAVRSFFEGSFVGITNPKTIVFLLAILPQFVDASTGAAVGLQMLLLGGIFVTLCVIFDSVYALAAGAARDWFGKSPKRLSNLGVAGGVAMIGLGVGLAATGVEQK